ncbi:hypothetical protein FWK35_00002075 [Aphis craccivora]|uniref:Uncharacterized protein n=1 Tax=Aphis craccivora TaxID=307492 RepID=A0A6G0ZAA2_APHCR|nr:hypothetical protein FWK35_00002075 [Aphis craccivora]
MFMLALSIYGLIFKILWLFFLAIYRQKEFFLKRR